MNAAFSLSWIPLYFLYRGIKTGDRSRANRLCACFGAGALTCAFLVFLPFLFLGQGSLLWKDYFVYNLHYVSPSASGAKQWALSFYGTALGFSLPTVLGTLGMAGLLYLGRKKAPTQALALGALFVMSFLGVVAPGHQYAHYFLQMALPFALAPVAAVTFLPVGFQSKVGAFLLGICALFYVQGFRITSSLSKDNLNASLLRTVEVIRANSGPKDTLFVWGGETLINYLAQRPAPTRYFTWVHYKNNERHLREAYAALFASPPTLLVLHPHEEKQSFVLPPELLAHYQLIETVGPYQIFQLAALA